MIAYQCQYHSGKRTVRWQGSMEIIRQTPPYEMMVSARGSRFHILFGKHTYGNFLCIPNWNVGCEMAGLSDTFWNLERLTRQLKKTDATSVVYALAAAKEYLEI